MNAAHAVGALTLKPRLEGKPSRISEMKRKVKKKFCSDSKNAVRNPMKIFVF